MSIDGGHHRFVREGIAKLLAAVDADDIDAAFEASDEMPDRLRDLADEIDRDRADCNRMLYGGSW